MTVHKKTQLRWLFFSCLLVGAISLLCSCGKKGAPTLKSYENPPAPAAFRAIHRESEIILSWSFPKDSEQEIKGFYLMKSIRPALVTEKGDFKKVAFLESNKHYYIDKDFKVDTAYEYKIVSLNLKDVTGNDSNIIRITPENVPFPPGDIQFRIEHDSLILGWQSAGDKILYNIYRSKEKGKYQLTPLNKEPLKETSFRERFDIKNPVYYTIRSVAGDNEGLPSQEIIVDPSEFIPSSPSDLQATVTKDTVYLSWKEPPETWVTGYRIYREKNKKEGFILIGETQIPAFRDKDEPATKRNYRVTALGPSKEGPPAEIIDVVFIPFR